MRFLFPLGLIGLIGVPLLILIYILRSKYNEQTVPSTYLWTLSEKFFKRRNPLSGMTGIISLILQILMVICASLAIARPVFILPESASPYCFVIDATGSMNCENGDETYFDTAKEYIKKQIKDSNLGSSYTLICMSDNTSVIYERITDKDIAVDLLMDLECTDSPADAEEAMTRAQEYFDEDASTLIYLVTDKEYTNSENVEIVNISSQNATNYALNEVDGVLTEGVLGVKGNAVSYTSDATLNIELYINNSPSSAAKISLPVKAGEMTPFEISAKASGYSSFRVVITNDDILDADNEIIGYNLQSEASYSILIVSETPFFLEAALDAITDSEIDTVLPTDYIGQSGYGLYIFHSYTPETLPDAAVWLINASGSIADSGFGSRGVFELSVPEEIVMTSSTSTKIRKLLSGVEGKDIYISEYVKYSGMYTKFDTLFSYNSVPMIFAGVNGLGNREVVFAFDIHKSDITLSTDFVPLVTNLLEYLCPDLLDRSSFVCGEDADISITANMDSVIVTTPEGKENFVDTSTDIGSITLDRVGTYTIKVNVSGEEKTYNIFASASPEESDPTAMGTTFSITGEKSFEKTDGEYDPLVILFIIIAVAFTADWMVFCYEKYQLR